ITNAPNTTSSQTAQVTTFIPDRHGDDMMDAQILNDPLNPLKSIDVKQMSLPTQRRVC
ncbi:unnamed protein product, partial [Allacma fusca]